MVPTGANTYTYSSGSAIVSPLVNTSYNVTGTSSQGCVATNTAISNVTVNITPTVSVNSGSICTGNSFTMAPGGASTYTYSNGSAIVSPIVNTSYSVTGTSTNTCKGSKQFTVTVNKCTELNNQISEATFFKLFPNPNQGILNLETTFLINLTLWNQLGEIVFEKSFESGEHTIDMSHLSSGIYIAKIIGNQGEKNIRLVKSE
jgi:hypothetical protein